MPDGYEELRLEMACLGMSHENNSDIYRAKIEALGGMNYISPDNINKANSNRSDNLIEFIKDSYPYIKVEEQKKSGESSAEDLIAAYKAIMEGKI